MDFGLKVYLFNRVYDCDHELQDQMVQWASSLSGWR